MSRRRLVDYCGPRSSVDLGRIRRLGQHWVAMPKHDGVYVQITLDAAGRVATVLSSTGQPYRCQEARSLVGLLAGYPHSVLVGEGAWGTEAGLRETATRGYPVVHLFDALRIGRQYLGGDGYGARRDRLHEMVADLEQHAGRDRPWFLDRRGCAHSDDTGRFCRKIPRSWRRFPLVPQVPVRRYEELWEDVHRGHSEGLVLANLRAPVGRRRAKLKCKPSDTIDATVVDADQRRAVAIWAGQVFAVPRGKHDIRAGDIVEVRHNGFYERAPIPRFPRIVRVRDDLTVSTSQTPA